MLTDAATPDRRRTTPRVDAILADPVLVEAAAGLTAASVKRAVRVALERCRAGELDPADVVAHVVASLPRGVTSMRRVINATGVIVHTNLGRAPLSDEAVAALQVAAGPTDVELDLVSGDRALRGAATMAALAGAVPEAGGVHVVNNGAAALALVTRALACDGGEVVIARGEMVEIGDGFRVPELLESVGARLREVGTTNRVTVADYESAVGPSTAFILKVHPSNYRVEGFTSAVGTVTLARLGPPVVVDIGSGLLVPHPRLPHEPDASTALSAGATIVTASGDKLLGGPQCGLLLGDADVVHKLRRHPLSRAMRVDKLTLAALEATLTRSSTPVALALSQSPDELLERAHRLADRIGRPAEAVVTAAVVGGGGAPGLELESAAVSLPVSVARRLRGGPRPIVGHVHRDRLLLDLVAVPSTEDERIATSVMSALQNPED